MPHEAQRSSSRARDDSIRMVDVNDPSVAPMGFWSSNVSATANDHLRIRQRLPFIGTLFGAIDNCRAKSVAASNSCPSGSTVPFMTRQSLPRSREWTMAIGLSRFDQRSHRASSCPGSLPIKRSVRATTVRQVVIEGVAEGEGSSPRRCDHVGRPEKSRLRSLFGPAFRTIADSATEPTARRIAEVALLLREWCIVWARNM